MQTLPIDKIFVPENRQRKKFNSRRMEELKAGILSKGLMHPVVVERLSDGTPQLIAGERRLRTFKEIWGSIESEGENTVGLKCNGLLVPYGEIPITWMEELDDLARAEAELEENVLREDLTVQEKAAAYQALHELRVKQKGEYNRSESAKTGAPVGQSLKATAEEISGDFESKSEEIQATRDLSDFLTIAEHLNDPEVAAAKDKKTAMKAIRDTAKAKQRKELAEQFDLSQTPHILIHGDCYEHNFNGTLFDVVLTDPPYGKDFDKVGSHADGTSAKYDDSDAAFQDVLNRLPNLCKLLTKEQAHVWVFCDIRRWSELFAAFELEGFACWPRPLIWDKGNTGSYGDMEFGFRQTYEAILFANKGRRPMAKASTEVLRFQNPTGNDHPNAKPVELFTELLSRSVYPTNEVIDPYCGSGPIFEAATELKCVATGVEKYEEYYHMSYERLERISK